MSELQFYEAEGVLLPTFISRERLLHIVSIIKKEEEANFNAVEYSWLNQNEMRELNEKYLNKTYLTDIITFRIDEPIQGVYNNGIEGVICISLDRVEEQSVELNVPFEQECYRVCIHGLLHLLGYEDESDAEKQVMRAKEDFYLRKMNLL